MPTYFTIPQSISQFDEYEFFERERRRLGYRPFYNPKTIYWDCVKHRPHPDQLILPIPKRPWYFA